MSSTEFSISRVFDAPRNLVWKAVTESEGLLHWWGPKGFTVLTCNVDLRPGGLFQFSMRAPDGKMMFGKWVYREIAPPERLVSVVSDTDEQGNMVRHFANAAWPLEILYTMTLTEHGEKTTMSVVGAPINATEEERKAFDGAREFMDQGFHGTLDKLEIYLAKGNLV